MTASDLKERLRKPSRQLHRSTGALVQKSAPAIQIEAADHIESLEVARDAWKVSHARIIEGFVEVCEAVGVNFDAPEAVAYAINAKVSSLETRIARLSEALEPFATYDKFNKWCPDETVAFYISEDGFDEPCGLTVGDFRRARALANEEGGK